MAEKIVYNIFMDRVAIQDLWGWFNNKDRRPLIIRGARQVGKSTLVRLFAEKYKLELLEINLEKVKLSSVTKDDFEINTLLDELQLKAKKRITPRTLIFFDEIQESPHLLKFLRYFYEERPKLAVVAAGSLLEIALKRENFSFPVGRVEFYHLGPMSFTEFLWATDNHLLVEKIKALDYSQAVVDEAKKQLVNYYYIGGMPRAIKTFVDENSLFSVREIQEQIIQTYIADFPKYNSRINVDRVERVFYSIISQLGKKIIYTKLEKDGKSREIRKALELLIDARVVLKCSHSDANTSPLRGEMDESVFKIYFLDIGLVNAIMRLEFDTIDMEMEGNFNSKGMIAEQFVAQHLAYLHNARRGPELYYWLKDKGIQKGEIDFLIQNKEAIIPIKVKSASVGHLKSLYYFSRDKKKNKAIKISMEDYSSQRVSHKINNDNVELNLVTLPHYAIEEIYSVF